MVKKFLVEIDYKETPQNIKDMSHVITDVGIECTLDNMMYDYACHQSISLSHGYKVDVKLVGIN